MTINWYPGHMKKTKELIQENLKLIDVVVELLDARIPVSSKNPQIDDLLKGKLKIVVFNKFDLADPEILESWINYYKSKGIKSIPINCITGEGVNRLVHEIKVTAGPIIEKLAGRAYDMVKNKEGKIFHGEFFLYIMEDSKRMNLGVDAFQVIQIDYDKLKIKVVPGASYNKNTEGFIRNRIKDGFGHDTYIEFDKVEFIPREKSGKMRVVVGMSTLF